MGVRGVPRWRSVPVSPVDRWLGLRPAEHRVQVERGLAMTAPEGTRLLATRYAPRGLRRGPVLLLRTPYGRDGVAWSRLLPRPLAARGHQVVVQSVRGTFGSGGVFRPGRHERQDGQAAVGWVRSQPWCDGRVVMAGGSYLALTQWAVAPYLDQPLEAMGVSIGSSTMLGGWYPGGAFAAQQALLWAVLLDQQERPGAALRIWRSGRRAAGALRRGDHRDADRAVTGRTLSVYQEVADHVADPEHWAGAVDHSAARDRLTTPVSMLTGWHDLFLVDQLADFTTLVAAGRRPRITIGPWFHGDTALVRAETRHTLELLERHWGGAHDERAPVRVFVQGIDQWRDLDSWPPPASAMTWQLHHDGTATSDDLTWPAPPRERHAPADMRTGRAVTDRTLTFDPADPTPARGGPALRAPAGRQVQTPVEARADVLVHTSDPLRAPLEVIGAVTARIPVTTTARSALLVVRLCDVDPRGLSRNVTEGLLHLTGGADTPAVQVVDVALHPTAHVFCSGHRLRVHIAPGAHPRVVDPGDGCSRPAAGGDDVPGGYRLTIGYNPESHPTLTLPFTGAHGTDPLTPGAVSG